MIERPYEKLYCDECKNRYVFNGKDRCAIIKVFKYCTGMCAEVLTCYHFEKNEKLTNQEKL